MEFNIYIINTSYLFKKISKKLLKNFKIVKNLIIKC